MALNACSFYIGTHAHKKQARKHATHTDEYKNTGLIVSLWTRAERFSDLHQAETSEVWSGTWRWALWWKEITAKPNRDLVMDRSMLWFGRLWSLFRARSKISGIFAFVQRHTNDEKFVYFHLKSRRFCSACCDWQLPLNAIARMLKSSFRYSWWM